ncbi:uncharacterized protein LOC113279012 [Papaver somniferum]|uniref:uncharacterized protein LOC113279012 n=1 Tax=Papaver somniferum TaxID=3469 RepID=UPI000E6F5336|nr:uncharacterized protein LOC113279012 [Papaver somniferum]
MEVIDAIKELGDVKAPGPDGYPIIFFKKCWSFLKEDVMKTIDEFNTKCKINSLHNATFISLVPKKNHVESVLDLRPISLLTSMYKIISKVLPRRLRFLMPKIISETQSAYVDGRKIHDSILIVNELVDSKIKEKLLVSFVKLTSRNPSIRLTGRIYNLGLGRLDSKTNGATGFISITLQLHSRALKCLEIVSGLRVNNSKTRFICVGETPQLASWAQKIGCLTDNIPFMYLGLALRPKYNSKAIWDPVVEKFDIKVATLQKTHLTKGGTIILIKHVLSSLALYFFSLFKAPVSITILLEKKIRDFLWNNSDDSNKKHLNNWSLTCTSINKGGLGFRVL